MRTVESILDWALTSDTGLGTRSGWWMGTLSPWIKTLYMDAKGEE